MPFDGHARASSSVHDWEDFLGMTNDDDDDDDKRRRTIAQLNIIKCECPRLKRGPYHRITISPYLTPHRISHTQYNTLHVPYLISRAT